jgi:hypothetical protein
MSANVGTIHENDDDWESVSVANSECEGPVTRSSSSRPDPFVNELARQICELTMNVSSLMSRAGQPCCVKSPASAVSDVLPSPSASSVPGTVPGTTNALPAASCLHSSLNNEPATALTNGARVSKKTVQHASAGEFVNLIEFVPTSEP